MWPIDSKSQQLANFEESTAPKYAILSHTWDVEELSLADLQMPKKRQRRKRGFRKLEFVSEQALKDGLAYVWLDTCCIDKTSSIELSEAVQSMYRNLPLAGTRIIRRLSFCRILR